MSRRIALVLVITILLGGGLLLFRSRSNGRLPGQVEVHEMNLFDGLRNDWIADLEAHRLQPSLDLYASDAVFINPDGTHSIGSAAIRSLYESVFAAFDAQIRMVPMSHQLSGNLAFESGTYTEQTVERRTQKVQNVHGDYLTVYRLEKPNRWLIVQQVWTEAPQSK